MHRVIVSTDGSVLQELVLAGSRTTIGRRPYNDIVIDNLAVSGEHAVLLVAGQDVVLEDLDSTNGTYVNGKAIRRHLLRPDDRVEIGKYRLTLVREGGASPAAPPTARVLVLGGPAAGRELELVKVVSTVGKPGVAVASITRRDRSFLLAHVEGSRPVVNGVTVQDEPVALVNGDVLEVAGARMQFIQAG